MHDIAEGFVNWLETPRSEPVVTSVDPLGGPGWDAAVKTHPHANVFHTGAWCRVLRDTYRHRPFYLDVSQAGEPSAFVPLMEVRSAITGARGVSLPFSDFCDVLQGPSGSPVPVFASVVELARERKWSHFEARGSGYVPADASPAVSYYAHKLDLRGGPEAIHRRLRSSVQRALRKCSLGNLTVSVSQSESAMREFYRLHAITRQRHGLPPQSLEFFLNIHREIVAPGMGSIVEVQLEGVIVSAMVFFHSGKVGIYKFGASDKAFQHFRPNNLAMWKGIQLLAEKGMETLHFGRSSLGNTGLRRFKLGWGASEEPLHYYRYNTGDASWAATRDRTEGIHTCFFKFLPPALNRLAGKILYAHLD